MDAPAASEYSNVAVGGVAARDGMGVLLTASKDANKTGAAKTRKFARAGCSGSKYELFILTSHSLLVHCFLFETGWEFLPFRRHEIVSCSAKQELHCSFSMRQTGMVIPGGHYYLRRTFLPGDEAFALQSKRED